jgi:benzoyl-CoA 2,3-dioxygenase component B
MNLITRNAYVRDCQIGLTRWNRLIAKAGFQFELKLPADKFHRTVGVWAGFEFDADGRSCTPDVVIAALPSEEDRGYIKSLMIGITEPGQCANWTSPPDRGINNMAFDFEYVRAA